MKKIDIMVKLENFLVAGFYPVLFISLIGILKLFDGLYLQDFPLLLRTVIFCTGMVFGATLGYVGAILIGDTFFPRFSREMELPPLQHAMEESINE
jgi:hypothetical protein